MSNHGGIWFLEEVDLFQWFCPVNGAADRYEKMPKRHYKKGEFIYFNDDTADKVFFIHAGAVKVAGYSPTGEELIKAVLHPGEIFGELAVFGEEKRQDFAQAVEDTELCMQTREMVVSLMRDVNSFGRFINSLVGRRVIYTQKRMESLLFKDARTRVIEYILEQASKNGKTLLDGAVSLRNYLTHQEIANYTGTSRQTVTTVLNELREARVIDFDRKKIIIRQPQALEAEAGTSASA